MIFLIAGTKSARELAKKLAKLGYSVIATTTTDYGKKLFETQERITVLAGKLQENEMEKLTEKYKVKLIIDASHPYSVEIKKNAILLSKKKNIPILRYDRKPIIIYKTNNFTSYEEVAKYLKKKQGNVLLTIGSNNVHYFKESPERKIYVRVLPSEDSIAQCRKGGIMPDRIIAMQYTFSEKFEKALYKELDIKYMVTKESGNEGGTAEKITAALDLKIEVLLIERPKTEYIKIYYDAETIITKTEEILNG